MSKQEATGKRARMFVALDLPEVVREDSNEGGGSRQPRRVENPSGPAPTHRIGWFDAVRISLYRSELQPSGARYVPLAQVELPAGSSEVMI